MGFFDFLKSKGINDMSLDEKLKNNFLPNQMQAKMYNEARSLKFFGDKVFKTQSKNDAIEYQQSVIQAINASVEIYEWLKQRGISEINGIVIISSFYLVNLADVTFENAREFSDRKITNMVDSFIAVLGVSSSIDTSSYVDLIKITVKWLLNHPTN